MTCRRDVPAATPGLFQSDGGGGEIHGALVGLLSEGTEEVGWGLRAPHGACGADSVLKPCLGRGAG